VASSQPPVRGAGPGAPLRPWSSLRVRDFGLLWGGSLCASIANQVYYAASLFQVYDLSGSAIQLGLTGLFQALPFVFLGLLGGAVADVFDRKRVLAITQAVLLLPALAQGVLTATGQVQVWHIYLSITATSLVTIFSRPARMALIPRLVPRSHLMNAVTLNTTADQSTFLFGPLLAGLFIDFIGTAETYYLTSALFIPAALAALAIRTSGKPKGVRPRLTVRSLYEGVQFVWVQRIILSLFLLDLGATIVSYYKPLLPVFAKDVYHVPATGLGLLLGAPAIGSILGSVGLLLAGNVKRQGALVLVAAVVFGASLALLGLAPWFWLALVAVGILGCTDSLSVSVRRTTVQLLAPDEMRGRAISMLSVFAQLANSLGALVAGIAAALLGAPHALLLGSALCVATVIAIGFAIPQLWRYRAA
jgi:MFS family permease